MNITSDILLWIVPFFLNQTVFCLFKFCNSRRKSFRWLKKPATIINLYLDNRTAKETT